MTPSSGSATVLYLDVEGGWGGSSRSLFYLIGALDCRRIAPVVALRKPGPVEARYAAMDVPHAVVSAMPSFRPAERKNWLSLALFMLSLRRSPELMAGIRRLTGGRTPDLIHVNHESLALTGWLLARRLGVPWVCHIRTQLLPGWYARRVIRLIARKAAAAICIAEPVRDHFAALAGDAFDVARTHVVHNSMPVAPTVPEPLPELAEPGNAFRVVSLTNFSPNRGVDRVVDVAAALAARGRRDIVFLLCGRPAHVRALTGGRAGYYESVVDRVRRLSLEDMVRFPGHVAEPERALAASHALIKLTREANPWGRDIMEGLAAGLPVVTLGRFDGFVRDGENGYLRAAFNPDDVADYFVQLADDPGRRAAIATANRERARMLFDPAARAAEVMDIYDTVLER